MKILYACSLTSERHHFDGERRKSTTIYELLKDKYKVTIVNFTKNKYLQMMKFIFCLIFVKYDFVFMAKAPSGGNIMLRAMRLLKYPRNKIAFYTYGRGFQGDFEKKVKYENINYAGTIVCEAESIKKEFINRGITTKIMVFPVVKHYFNIDVPSFEKKETLHGIFISRIVVEKGVLDLLKALEIVNNEKIKFTATFSGGWADKESIGALELAVKEKKYIKYLGETFSINNKEDYKFLASFDLHFFPTKFFHDCIPGSVVDSYIAGLPTISSEYACCREIMNDQVAFFYKFMSIDDLVIKLNYVYEHQEELYNKRINAKREAALYSDEYFITFFEQLLKINIFSTED